MPRVAGWRKLLTPEQRADLRLKDRDRATRRRREAGVPQTSAADRARLGAAARWAGHERRYSFEGRAPAEIRSLHSRADANSQLRRRYPTAADLDAAWRRGELEAH